MSRTCLGDVASEVKYGYTASATDENTGTRFLRGTDVKTGFIDWRSVPYCEISPEDLKKYELKRGDIVVTRMGAIGLNALIRNLDGGPAVFASYLIRFRINAEVADPEFIGLVLRSPLFRQFIYSHGGGSVQPNINAKVLRTFAFDLPELVDQRRIAALLGAMDRRVELNLQTNHTLVELQGLLLPKLLDGEIQVPDAIGDLSDVEA
jgi:type I restriction enzyme, S subunit